MMQGTYSDLKIIKGRKVMQMVIEFPLEASSTFTECFGLPQPDMEQWVVVAKLKEEAVRRNEGATVAIQQAGILCKEEAFGVWLRDSRGMSEVDPTNPDTIAQALRAILGIRSRADLSTDKEALDVWNRLKTAYDNQKVS